MEVEVFRTDVQHISAADRMTDRLRLLFPNGRITFDLEDCDRVLRVETLELDVHAIVSTMRANGFLCEILS